MGYIGRSFTSRGQELSSLFSANTGKEVLHQVLATIELKDKRSWFSEGERSAVQLP